MAARRRAPPRCGGLATPLRRAADGRCMACSAASGSRAAIASTIAECSAKRAVGPSGQQDGAVLEATICELSVRDRRLAVRARMPRGSPRAAERSHSRARSGRRASRRRRISSMISRSPAIAASSASIAACRAARPSSAERASRISTASRSETRLTRAPRWRSRSTSPSCSRRTSAIRTAARPARAARSDPPRAAAPGQQLSVNDRLAQILVTVGPDRHMSLSFRLRHLTQPLPESRGPRHRALDRAPHGLLGPDQDQLPARPRDRRVEELAGEDARARGRAAARPRCRTASPGSCGSSSRTRSRRRRAAAG